jgi:hypothetical protein
MLCFSRIHCCGSMDNAAVEGDNRNSHIKPNPSRGGKREPHVPINLDGRGPWDKASQVPCFQGMTMFPKPSHQLIKSAWMLVHSYLKYLAHDPTSLPQA